MFICCADGSIYQSGFRKFLNVFRLKDIQCLVELFLPDRMDVLEEPDCRRLKPLNTGWLRRRREQGLHSESGWFLENFF